MFLEIVKRVFFSVERGVTFINGYVVRIIQRKVHLYTSSTVNIKDKPRGHDYEPWADAIHAANGQIGLLAEEATIRAGIDWDKDCEGTVVTKVKL